MVIEKYKNLIQNLLPQGLAWPREKETNMENFLTASAVELSRVDTRVQDMLREAYPLTTGELLTDWERVTGLPEPCQGLGGTIQRRREEVHRKLSSLGGQSKQYYIDLAASVGYAITITEFRPFTVGINAAGDPVYGEDWAYTWQVNAPEETVKYFAAGQGSAGDPLASWGNELLECVISRLKPAYTVALFAYNIADGNVSSEGNNVVNSGDNVVHTT